MPAFSVAPPVALLFNVMTLSAKEIVSVLMLVVVPETVRLPATVTLAPDSVMAVVDEPPDLITSSPADCVSLPYSVPPSFNTTSEPSASRMMSAAESTVKSPVVLICAIVGVLMVGLVNVLLVSVSLPSSDTKSASVTAVLNCDRVPVMVLLPKAMLLLVRVSVVSRPTKVVEAVGSVTVPVLLIVEMMGLVNVLLVKVSDPANVANVPEVGSVTLVEAVEVNVTEWPPDVAKVEPSDNANVADEVGAVIATLFTLVAVATPNTGVTKVGVLANTKLPDPVSSVIADARLALDAVARNAATLAPKPEIPVATGRPVQLVNVPELGVPKTGVVSVGLVNVLLVSVSEPANVAKSPSVKAVLNCAIVPETVLLPNAIVLLVSVVVLDPEIATVFDRSALASSNPPAVVPSCTRMVSTVVSTVISPTAPVKLLFCVVVPRRNCTCVGIYILLKH